MIKKGTLRHHLDMLNIKLMLTGQALSGMLSPRTGLGLEAENYILGLGLIATGLGLVYVMASASCCLASWPRCSLDKVTNRVLHYDTSDLQDMEVAIYRPVCR